MCCHFQQDALLMRHILTLAGGDVRGLLEISKSTSDVINLSSTGSVAILLQLISNATNFKRVSSKNGLKKHTFFIQNKHTFAKIVTDSHLEVNKPVDCFSS